MVHQLVGHDGIDLVAGFYDLALCFLGIFPCFEFFKICLINLGLVSLRLLIVIEIPVVSFRSVCIALRNEVLLSLNILIVLLFELGFLLRWLLVHLMFFLLLFLNELIELSFDFSNCLRLKKLLVCAQGLLIPFLVGRLTCELISFPFNILQPLCHFVSNFLGSNTKSLCNILLDFVHLDELLDVNYRVVDQATEIPKESKADDGKVDVAKHVATDRVGNVI